MRRQRLLALPFLGLLLSVAVRGQSRASPTGQESTCPLVSTVEVLTEVLGCPDCGCKDLTLGGRHAIYNFGPKNQFPPATISSNVIIRGSAGVVVSFDTTEGTVEVLPGFVLQLKDITIQTDLGATDDVSEFLTPVSLEFGRGSTVALTNARVLVPSSTLDAYIDFAKDNLKEETFKVFFENGDDEESSPYLEIFTWESPTVVANNVTLVLQDQARVVQSNDFGRHIEASHAGELLGALRLADKSKGKLDRIEIKNDIVLNPENWDLGEVAVSSDISIVGAGDEVLPLLDLSLIRSAVLVRDGVVELEGIELINLGAGSKDEEKYGMNLWFFFFKRDINTGLVVKNTKLVVSCAELASIRYALDTGGEHSRSQLPQGSAGLIGLATEWEVGEVQEDLVQLVMAKGFGVQFQNVDVLCRTNRGILMDVDSQIEDPRSAGREDSAKEKHEDAHKDDNLSSGFVMFKVLLALLIPIFLLLGVAFIWKLQRMRLKAVKELEVQEDDTKSVALTGQTMNKRPNDVLRKSGRGQEELPGTCSSERTNGQSSTKYGSAWDMRSNQVAEFIPDILAVTENIDDKQLVLLELLGQGSSGSVHKGKWRELPVAVKTIVFRGNQNDSQERQQAAIREVAITSGLAHPNVVCTYSYDIKRLTDSGANPNSQSWDPFVDWKLFIIQEYCDGGSLKKALESCMLMENGGPDLEKILESASGIARGIHHIHSKNIIHGDLKTNNVLLKETDQNRSGYIVKIADFGFSLKMQGSQTHVSNVQGGTPFYMAPEVLELGSSSKAADVYAFGVILWEMYTSQFSKTGIPTPHALLHFPRLPLTCPILYAVVTVTCMQPNPSQRPTFYDIVGVLSQMWQQLRLGTMLAPAGVASRLRSRGAHEHPGDGVFQDLEAAEAIYKDVVAMMPPGFQDLTFDEVYWSQTS